MIPEVRGLRSVLDRIGNHASEERVIQGNRVTFIVEEVRKGSVHACSVQDVSRLLDLIPASDWVGIKTIVFRQPTRKQAILNPAWGRLRYSGEVSTVEGRIIAIGAMILLEAIDENLCFSWSSALSPENQVELDRLRADGHGIERAGQRFKISVTPYSARNTQLFRTLPHEIGHWFDWLEKVEAPALRGGSIDALMDHYFARPIAEREAFAHRYADRIRKNLTDHGSIPFHRGAEES